MAVKKTKILKVDTKYHLTDGKFAIYAIVHEITGKLTVERDKDYLGSGGIKQGFVFKHSNKEVVEKIGKLIVEASKL